MTLEQILGAVRYRVGQFDPKADLSEVRVFDLGRGRMMVRVPREKLCDVLRVYAEEHLPNYIVWDFVAPPSLDRPRLAALAEKWLAQEKSPNPPRFQSCAEELIGLLMSGQ